MNPVLILSYNGLPLLKKCVESVRKQDIPTTIYVFDNASKDGTRPYLNAEIQRGSLCWNGGDKNLGVSKGWNEGLGYMFGHLNCDYVLTLNQDIILGPSAYRELLAFNIDFVTGFPVDTLFEISPLAGKPQIGLTPYPCFSAFLIRRSCWEKVGPFEEPSSRDASDGFFAWAGDCDYHVRAHRLGVELLKSGIPFYHEASSTLRNAPDEEKKWLIERGNKDRAVFKSLYGVEPGQEGYSGLFK